MLLNWNYVCETNNEIFVDTHKTAQLTNEMLVNPNNVGEIANEMLANTHEPWGDLTNEMGDNW